MKPAASAASSAAECIAIQIAANEAAILAAEDQLRPGDITGSVAAYAETIDPAAARIERLKGRLIDMPVAALADMAAKARVLMMFSDDPMARSLASDLMRLSPAA